MQHKQIFANSFALQENGLLEVQFVRSRDPLSRVDSIAETHKLRSKSHDKDSHYKGQIV